MSSSWDRQAFDRSALQPLIVVSGPKSRHATLELHYNTARVSKRMTYETAALELHYSTARVSKRMTYETAACSRAL